MYGIFVELIRDSNTDLDDLLYAIHDAYFDGKISTRECEELEYMVEDERPFRVNDIY